MSELLTLWRPVGRAEFELLEESGMRRWPPRLDAQPIFYPVLNVEYATQIARDWNTTDEVSGYLGVVTEFDVDGEFAEQFDRRNVTRNCGFQRSGWRSSTNTSSVRSESEERA